AQHHMLSWVMRTCPGGGHAGAHTAVKGVLKEQRLDAELARRERPEDVVCVVCAVIVANPCVVSAYDEMRAAVVLTQATRVLHWSRRRPVIQASRPPSTRASGRTLRTSQHRRRSGTER